MQLEKDFPKDGSRVILMGLKWSELLANDPWFSKCCPNSHVVSLQNIWYYVNPGIKKKDNRNVRVCVCMWVYMNIGEERVGCLINNDESRKEPWTYSALRIKPRILGWPTSPHFHSPVVCFGHTELLWPQYFSVPSLFTFFSLTWNTFSPRLPSWHIASKTFPPENLP